MPLNFNEEIPLNALIGIRREDKNIWERRAPLAPDNLRELQENHGIEAIVQPSKIRVFSDKDYRHSGAKVSEDLSPCNVVFALKEIPIPYIETQRNGMVYFFFAHVIKGQSYNMPMLQKLVEKEATLIDYERVVDSKSRRLLFFGNYAGFAGMHITLWALGQRLIQEGIDNPFSMIHLTSKYKNLELAKKTIREVGKKIRVDGLPSQVVPFVCGFAGYGNVSQGAQEIYDLLPVRDIAPGDLPYIFTEEPNPHFCYKVVFKEEDMVSPKSPNTTFELQDYYDYPEKYKGVFESFVQYLCVLVNGIYWEERYPRLITKEYLQQAFATSETPRLRIIGDISCDIEGAIEVTSKPSTPGQPLYTYDPEEKKVINGIGLQGPTIMAIDNLPGLLPLEASLYFSETLKRFIPAIAAADYTKDFDHLNVPLPIRNAIIAHKGELTQNYQYLKEFIS